PDGGRHVRPDGPLETHLRGGPDGGPDRPIGRRRIVRMRGAPRGVPAPAAACAALLFAQEAGAHPPAGARAGAGGAVLRWSDWTWDPAIVPGLALTVLGYPWLAPRFPARRRQWVRFSAGVLALPPAPPSP